jgi:CheY-like chemotaxis protein
MTTDTVSPLRQRMIEDMNSRKLGAHTQRSHISSCKRFAAFLKRPPDTATREDIRLFQLHLAETGMSICNRNRIAVFGCDAQRCPSGFDLHRRLQSLGRSIPTVLITGQPNENVRTQALSLGITCYLPKPFRHEDERS